MQEKKEEEIEQKASYCLNCKVRPCSLKGCPLGHPFESQQFNIANKGGLYKCIKFVRFVLIVMMKIFIIVMMAILLVWNVGEYTIM